MKSKLPSRLRTLVTTSTTTKDKSEGESGDERPRIISAPVDRALGESTIKPATESINEPVGLSKSEALPTDEDSSEVPGRDGTQSQRFMIHSDSQLSIPTYKRITHQDSFGTNDSSGNDDSSSSEDDVRKPDGNDLSIDDSGIQPYAPSMKPHHITYNDADSIIGGHSIKSHEFNREHEEDEDIEIPTAATTITARGTASAAAVSQSTVTATTTVSSSSTATLTVTPEQRTRSSTMSTTSTTWTAKKRHTHGIPALKQDKIFSFSLPFNNPLANMELPSFASLDLPTINFRSMMFNANDNASSQGSSQKDYLSELEEIDSDEEDIRYGSIRHQDNTRVRAVRNTLSRNLTLPLTPTRPDNFPQINGDVVIMGGYRGSILRDRKTGRRIWIPIKVGLNIRKIDLTVGIKDQDEYDMANDNIYPDGMLTHVGPVDISRRLIRRMAEQQGCRVHEFGYDWRLSSDINSKRLREFLRRIRKQRGRSSSEGRGAIVIAHSMGGLIAHHAMQEEPDLFRGLLYAGVPSSCPNILGPLRYGDSVLLSSRVLTAKVNFLMRSSYVFLPMDGRCFVDRYDTSKRYDLDFFDVNTWIEYGLSPCVSKSPQVRAGENSEQDQNTLPLGGSTTFSMANASIITDRIWAATTTAFNSTTTKFNNATTTLGSSSPLISPIISMIGASTSEIPFDDAKEYLDRTLKRTKKFLLELEAKQDVSYPPLAILYGNSLPTLRGAKVDGEQGIREGDYDHLLFGAGDGVVYRKNLMPEGFGFKTVAKVASECSHVTLLTDIDGVAKALTAILEEEARRTEADIV